MSKFLAGLTIVAALILFTPAPSSAASKSHGIRADQHEFSSQRYRRVYRRAVYVRPAYRPWRRAYWGGPRWGWGGGYYRPWRAASYAYNPYWGSSYGFYRPWRPYAWGRPWGWGGYRSYAWGGPRWGWGRGRGWGWGGPRWGVGFGW